MITSYFNQWPHVKMNLKFNKSQAIKIINFSVELVGKKYKFLSFKNGK